MTTDAAPVNIRRRIRELHDQIAQERAREINRAVEYKDAHNTYMAGYHTGLADGRNAMLSVLRLLAREYPVGAAVGADEAAAVRALRPGGAS